MEEILKKIIDIDNNAKSIISVAEENEKNIDELIEEQTNKKKAMLDMEYKIEIGNKEKKYKELFEQKKNEIDLNTKEKIEQLEKKYRENEQKVMNDIIRKIKNEED